MNAARVLTIHKRRDRRAVWSDGRNDTTPSVFDWLFAGLFLLLGMHANIRYLQSDIGWALIYVVAVLALLLRVDIKSIRVPLSITTISLTAYMLLMMASVAWSETPSSSFRAVVALTGTTILGIYLAHTFRIPQIMQLTLAVLLGVMALSWAMAVFNPNVGQHVESSVREWRGIILHKNALGTEMALLVAGPLAFARWRRVSAIVAVLISIPTVVLLYLTDSLEGQLLALVLVALALVLPINRGRVRIAQQTVRVGLAIGIITGVALLPRIVEFISSNPAVLSGRALIWEGVLDEWKTRPLLGFGYGGFWHGVEGPAASVVARFDGYIPYHAHNGALELLIAGGAVGLVVFAVFSLRFVVNAWNLFLAGPTFTSHILILYIGYVGFQSIVSNPVPGYQSSTWMIMVAFALIGEHIRCGSSVSQGEPHSHQRSGDASQEGSSVMPSEPAHQRSDQ